MTPSTTNLNRGEVVLVGFQFESPPGTSLVATKRRPCVVLSSDWFHSRRQETVLAAITSNQVRVLLPGEVRLQGWSAAGLMKPSTVTMILRTVKRDAVVVTLGTLTTTDFTAVEESLRRSLGL